MSSPLGPQKCNQCGKPFTPREAHHRTCDECFRKKPARSRDYTYQPSASRNLDYLKKGYFADDERGVLFPELLTTRAVEFAQDFANANVSMGQVRRYFTMARSLENRLESNESYDVVANELRRMKANVAAVVGRLTDERQRKRLAETLKSFIDQNVDAAVRDEPSFLKGFVPHFECVLAYFYWYNSQKGGGRRDT